MTNRFQLPFRPVESTAPSFEVALTSANSTANALESTAIFRYWRHGPGSRAIRLATKTADDYYVSFGSTLAVAASTDSMLLLGGTVEIFDPIRPGITHIALQSSTDVTVNVTIGHGQ